MPEDRFRAIGDVNSPGGAILMISGFDGARKALEYWATEHLKRQGIEITESVQRVIKEFAATQVNEIETDLVVLGVPEYIAKIFSLDKKSQVQKYLRTVTLTQDDFVALINNSQSIGFSHQLIRKEFVPDHLNLTKKDLAAIRGIAGTELSKEARSTFRKIGATFKERKVSHCHLFERGEEWHAFVFSYDDIRGDTEPHWEHGTHLHYLSHLWGTVKKEDLLKSLEARRGGDGGGEHVKIQPYE